MKTVYSHNSINRMTKIEHKDGSNVKQSFQHILDKVGNIEKVYQAGEELNTGNWEYAYDSRYRLTMTTRNMGGGIAS